MPFVKTDKQKEVITLMSANRSSMVFGGSRSGKSAVICYAIITRAVMYPGTTHMVVRRTYKSTKSSLWKNTFPTIFKMAYPTLWSQVNLDRNESDREFILPNGSRIVFGGTGDISEVEKLLGNEYSSIWFNECSEWADYEVIETVLTRLSEDKGCMRRAYYDMNPTDKKHWTHKLCIEDIHPITGEQMPDISKVPWIRVNPESNEANLPADYIEEMKASTGRRRKRYWLGEFMSDVDGALWSFDMIQAAKVLYDPDIVATRTVVAVDPAAVDDEDSDSTGIVVADELPGKQYRITNDYSGQMTAAQTVHAAVEAFDKHEAAFIVVEKNNGGDWLKALFLQLYPRMRGLIVMVHASKGKKARAEPISALYELPENDDQMMNSVSHAPGLGELEDEQMGWVPSKSKKSPGRIDAAVWAIAYLKDPINLPFIM